MRKIYSLLFMLSAACLWAQAPLLVEDFDYTAGDALTDHGWVAHSAPTTNPVLVTAPGLSFAGYLSSGIGNAAGVNNTGQDLNHTFAMQENTSVYTSFMVNIAAGVIDEYFLFVAANPIGTAFRGRIFCQPDGAGTFKFGLSFNASTAQSVTDATYNYGETYLLVMKYESITGAANDLVSLYIYSAGSDFGNEPATATLGPLTGTAADLNPATVGLRQFSPSQLITVDGIRVNTVWDIMADGPAASTVLAASTSLCYGDNTTLSLSETYTDVTYQWQNSADGNNFSDIDGADAATYTTSQTETTFYMAVITNEAGLSYTTDAIQIVTGVQISAPVLDGTLNFCGSATGADLPVDSNLVWYFTADGTDMVEDTTVLTSTTYYAANVEGDCESARTPVEVTIVSLSAPVASAQSFCNSATVADLQASMSGTGSIMWFASATTETALADTAELSSGSYFAAVISGGCESERTEVEVTINMVGAPTGSATQTINADTAEEATIADLTVTADGTVIWYATEADALAMVNPLSSSTQLADGATYYATQTVGSCTGTTTFAVTVTVTLSGGTFDPSPFSVYPNPVHDVLYLTAQDPIASVTVLNTLGQEVSSAQPNTAEVALQTASLPAGTYFVVITVGGSSTTVKIVK